MMFDWLRVWILKRATGLKIPKNRDLYLIVQEQKREIQDMQTSIVLLERNLVRLRTSHVRIEDTRPDNSLDSISGVLKALGLTPAEAIDYLKTVVNSAKENTKSDELEGFE
jgi:hypothetical protein